MIGVLAWPYLSLVPGTDADYNWLASLSLAVKHGLPFGHDLVWTYGPLGFLDTVFGPQLYFGDVTLLTFAYQLLVTMLLAGTLFVAARRSFPLLAAVPIAFVAATLAPDRSFSLGIAWCFLLAIRRRGEPVRVGPVAVAPIVLGVLVGIMLLGKLNQGVELLVLALIALATAPGIRRRDAGGFLGGLLVAAAIGWFATGQSFGDIWPYIRYGEQQISGYSDAMGVYDPTDAWKYWAAVFVLLAGGGLVAVAVRDASTRQRAGMFALWLLTAWFCFKGGYVRDVYATPELFFGDVLVALVAIPVSRPSRAFSLTVLAATALLVGAAFGPYRFDINLNPWLHAKTLVQQAHTLASSNRRGATKQALKAAIVANYALPPEIRAAVGDETVAGWPSSLGSLVYADNLNWRPLPLLEAYAAYTPSLDRLGASMLASSRAPARILRRNIPTVDIHYGAFDSPAQTVAMLCRYRPIAQSGIWQVLARQPNRCGAEQTIRTVKARWGVPVTIPRPTTPNALVLAKVTGASPAGLERIGSVLLRAHTRFVTLNGQQFHLTARTAPDGLLLSAPAGFDYPVPFQLAANSPTITISRAAGEPGGRLRYEFVQVPIQRFG